MKAKHRFGMMMLFAALAMLISTQLENTDLFAVFCFAVLFLIGVVCQALD